MKKLIEIYPVVQELCAGILTANGWTDRQDSCSDHSAHLRVKVKQPGLQKVLPEGVQLGHCFVFVFS